MICVAALDINKCIFINFFFFVKYTFVVCHNNILYTRICAKWLVTFYALDWNNIYVDEIMHDDFLLNQLIWLIFSLRLDNYIYFF